MKLYKIESIYFLHNRITNELFLEESIGNDITPEYIFKQKEYKHIYDIDSFYHYRFGYITSTRFLKAIEKYL